MKQTLFSKKVIFFTQILSSVNLHTSIDLGFLQTKAFGQTRWQRRYCIIDWDKAMLFIALKNDRQQGDYIKLLPKIVVSDSEIATDLTIEIIDDNSK